MINQIVVEGFICGEIQEKTFSTDNNVKNFSINSSIGRKNKESGEMEYTPNFIDVKTFNCKLNLKKGDQVLVTGKLIKETWEKDGEKKSKTLVQADNVKLIQNAKTNSVQGNGEDVVVEYADDLDDEINIDDIPF